MTRNSMIMAVLVLAACSPKPPEAPKAPHGAYPSRRFEEEGQFIGNATMLADRSIEVCYFIEIDTCKTYRPDDPEYGNVLRHSNGVKVGESRGLSPFEDGK